MQAGAGATADEDTGDEAAADEKGAVRSVGNRASEIFNTIADRRGHRSKMNSFQSTLTKAKVADLKKYYDEIKARDK